MSESSSSSDDAVLNILEQCILAKEQRAEVDLHALCGGDAELVARVEKLLASEPESMRRLASDSSARSDSPMPGSELDDAEREIGELGEFRLIARIGRGGMGTVYLAQQAALGRKVALKVLDPMALHERARARFHREAELAAALDHPHIVPIYGIGEDKGCSFIAMKLLSGPGLDSIEKPIAPREVARIGAAVARALDTAHLSGIVHRDIKPANVILDHGAPCLVDFGLARAQTDVTLTRQGTVPGTLAYLAPELMRGGAGLDPRSDVYALGATLYELLGGRAPFEGDTPEELVSQILLDEPRPLRLRGANRDLETIVMRALEKEPERRFATALEMAEDLERYLAGEPIRSKPSSVFDRAWKLARRHRTATTLLGVSALVALALAAMLSWKVIEKRRDLDRNVKAVNDALNNKDWTGAASLLSTVVQSNAGDARLAELAARLKGEFAHEALLDAVFNRPAGLRAEELEAVVTEARETGALTLHPRTGRLATAAAAYLLSRPEQGRAEVAELRKLKGSSLAVEAFSSLLDGASEIPMPDESADVDADERILIGLASYLTGSGNAGLRRESNIVLRRDPVHRRARYALALALAESGELAESERILQGLILPQSTPRDLWRNLSRVQLYAGKLAAARESLERVKEDDWTPVIAYQNLELLLREKRFDDFERALEKSRARFGDALFLRVTAAYRGIQERYDEALQLADRAVAVETDPMYRDVARAIRFKLQCGALEATSSREFLIPDQERAQYEEIVERGRRLSSEVRYPPAQQTIAWLLGRHLLRLRQVAAGLKQLDRAIQIQPWELEPLYDYVEGIYRLESLGGYSSVEQYYLASIARQRLPALLEAAERWNATPDLLREIHDVAVLLAMLQNDYRLAEPWLDQAIEDVKRAGLDPDQAGLTGFEDNARGGKRVLQGDE
jgi:serine/threonine protein kinase